MAEKARLRRSIAVVGNRSQATEVMHRMHHHPNLEDASTITLGELSAEDLRILFETNPGYAAVLVLQQDVAHPEIEKLLLEMQLRYVVGMTSNPDFVVAQVAKLFN